MLDTVCQLLGLNVTRPPLEARFGGMESIVRSGINKNIQTGQPVIVELGSTPFGHGCNFNKIVKITNGIPNLDSFRVWGVWKGVQDLTIPGYVTPDVYVADYKEDVTKSSVPPEWDTMNGAYASYLAKCVIGRLTEASGVLPLYSLDPHRFRHRISPGTSFDVTYHSK